METTHKFYYFENTLLKLLLLNDNKTKHVNELFAARNDMEEYRMLFQGLSKDSNKFMSIFECYQKHVYILDGIEASIKKQIFVSEFLQKKGRL